MKTDLIIIGAGGHAKVLIDCLLNQRNCNIMGILDNNTSMHGQRVLGIPVLGGDDKISEFPADAVKLVNAIGSVDVPVRRQLVFQQFKDVGYQFYSVIHANACIGQGVQLGEGVQVMAGAILQTECYIGDNVLINTGASIDHEVQLGNHTHIAPGVVISANVLIGDESHIGARAVIIQGLKIGKRCLVGAGAVVVNDVGAGERVVGVPAKRINVTEELA
jgi:sugar O-acyltransferase (sialic acid O-acetyltransferase NeuD family)